MRQAKEFDTDYQSTITMLQDKIEEALKDKQEDSQKLQAQENGMMKMCV